MDTKALSGDTAPADSQPDRYRWVMLALLWLLYACFGIGYRSLSPLITPILADLSITYSHMGFVLGSWQLTYIGAAVLSGFLIDRWGIKRSLFLGTVVIAFSAGLRHFSQGFYSFLFVVALFGVGGPMISVGCPKAISLWFRNKDRGTAIGIYLTGPMIGGAFALAATNRLIMPLTGYSWRLTFAFYGTLILSIAFLWWFLARDIETGGESETISMRSVFLRLIRVRNVQIALISGLLTFAIVHGLTSWLPKILESKGFSPALAGYASSTPLIAGIPSLLIVPRMIPPAGRGTALAVIGLVIGASVWMFFYFTGSLMFAGLILYGLSAWTLVPLLTLVLMETPQVGAKYMGAAGGLFFCISEIGGFLSPLAVGVLVDWSGTFQAGGYFIMVLGLIVFGLSFLIQDNAVSE